MNRQRKRRGTLGWTAVLASMAWAGSTGVLGAQTLPGSRSLPHGNRARIGISVGGDRPQEDGAEGVRILEVMEEGPADEAGLRQDDIVTRVGGRSLMEPLEDRAAEVRLDPEQSVPAQRLVALLGELDPGDEIEIEYVRDGETDTVMVTAEPNAPEMAALFGMRVPTQARRDLVISMDPCFLHLPGSGGVTFHGGNCIDGVDLVELNPALAEYFGEEEGVLVTDVRESSTLALRPGDVILAVDGRRVTGPDHARRVLESYEPDEDLTLRIVRHGQEMEVVGRRR